MAECGWIGLISLLLWFFYYYIQDFLNISRFKKSGGFFMAVGLFGSLSAIYGQSCLEWILKQQTNSYLLMIAFASISAMSASWRELKRFNGVI